MTERIMPQATSRLALDQVAGWIFDVDGCLVRTGRAGGEGGTLFPGAADLIQMLQEAGQRVVCCTNASLRTPAYYARSLRSLGLPLRDDAVLTAGYAAAYAAAERFPGKSVLALGGEGLQEPLDELGARRIAADGPAADVVIVGAAPTYTTQEIAAACRAIAAGAAFFVTVLTPWFYGGSAPVASATAVVTQGISWVTGVQPEVAGKPSANAMRLVLSRLKLPVERVVVVGDSIDAEIGMAAAAGAQSVWVSTGAPAPTPGMADSGGSPTPTLRVADVAELQMILTYRFRRPI
jgi:HAD superfamily hydrolase (TIGR01450 family)